MGNVITGQEDEGIKDFVLISNDIEPELVFEPSQSIALIFGIDEQTHPNYHSKSLGNTVKLDALETGLAVSEHLHIASHKTFCSSDSPDDCSKAGIISHIESCASQVGPLGIMIMFFGGHGVNDNGHEWGLAPADFDRTSDMYITAANISSCIKYCQAKAVILILDCCYSGMLGIGLTTNDLQLPNLYVLAAGTAYESSFSVLSLQHSIFSYFLKLGLSIHLRKLGTLPLTELFEFCKECTSALSSLILTIDNCNIKTKYVVPSLLHLDPKIEVGVEEVDGDITVSDKPGRLGFVFDLFSNHSDDNRQNKPRLRLHSFTLKWLRSLVVGQYQPLFMLKSRQLFDSNANKDGNQLLITVIAFIVQSIAVLELFHNPTTVGEPNLFLLSFIQAVSMVDFIVPNCMIESDHVIHSWALYTRVLKKHEVNDQPMMELFQKMKSRFNNPESEAMSLSVIHTKEWSAL